MRTILEIICIAGLNLTFQIEDMLQKLMVYINYRNINQGIPG